jgi:hypothetical protein
MHPIRKKINKRNKKPNEGVFPPFLETKTFYGGVSLSGRFGEIVEGLSRRVLWCQMIF